MLVLLCEGDLGTEGALPLALEFTKMEDLASQRACMAGEWNIPGHKVMGFRLEELASMGVTESDVVGSVESVER